MAAGLKRKLAAAALAMSVLHAEAVGAEILVDPTRPPYGAAGETGEAPKRPALQSIIISPQGRAAVIDGQRVELRGRYGDAQVVQITESEVVLRSPNGVETLKMYPGIDKSAQRAEPPRVKRGPETGRTQ